MMTVFGIVIYFIVGCIFLFVVGVPLVFLIIGITDPVKLDNIRRCLERDADRLQSRIDECEEEIKRNKEDKNDES